MEGLQKVVRWFLDANDNPNSHQNIIITFSPYRIFFQKMR